MFGGGGDGAGKVVTSMIGRALLRILEKDPEILELKMLVALSG